VLKLIDFLTELRRRKVWLFGGMYLAIAWMLFEVAIALEDTLALPNWVDQVALVLLMLGFPITLFLAWAQESTTKNVSTVQAQSPTKRQADLKGPPSVAVLPFENLSDNPEQAYFADGITEDLITALSHFPWLFVVSRGTSFSYKGESVKASRVADDLGVRYIVEGCVRMSSSRLRTNVQLVDAVNDRHIWAENYDRPTGDLFDLQDEIIQRITGVLVPALSGAEMERYQRENRPKLDAWSAYQKGLLHYYRPYSDVDHAESRRLFDLSIKLDPNFSDAHAMIAMMGVYSINSGQTSYTGSKDEILAEAKLAAERAVQLDERNALAHVALGRVNQLAGLNRVAISEGEIATRLNPNLAIAHYEFGFILYESGKLEESIRSFDRAIELSPNDPSRWNFFLLKGIALLLLGEFDRAIDNFEESSRLRPLAFWPFVGLAAAYVAQERTEDAQTAINTVLERNPDWTVTKMSGVFATLPSTLREIWLDYMRKAGLPEG
jgi:TolB-like protein/Tfp pilus assembly protein PilF